MPANLSSNAREAKGSKPAASTAAPGDIGRGTQETGSTATSEPASESIDFAADQSFGDPVHRDATRLADASEEE